MSGSRKARPGMRGLSLRRTRTTWSRLRPRTRSSADARGSDEEEGSEGERSEQDHWRRFGWVALAILTTGVAWALVLATILIDRSGDRTAELIALVEEGQQQRESALGQIPQSQKERRAALEAQRQQTRTLQAAGGGCQGESGRGTGGRPPGPGRLRSGPSPRPAGGCAGGLGPGAGEPGERRAAVPVHLPGATADRPAEEAQAAIKELREAIEDQPGRPGRAPALISL